MFDTTLLIFMLFSIVFKTLNKQMVQFFSISLELPFDVSVTGHLLCASGVKWRQTVYSKYINTCNILNNIHLRT